MRLPCVKGAVVFSLEKMTEGLLQQGIVVYSGIDFTIPPFFCLKTEKHLPLLGGGVQAEFYTTFG